MPVHKTILPFEKRIMYAAYPGQQAMHPPSQVMLLYALLSIPMRAVRQSLSRCVVHQLDPDGSKSGVI